jgi:hypothetical protein
MARREAHPPRIVQGYLAEKAVESGTIPGAAHRGANESAPVANESKEFPNFISRPKLSVDELENLLDQFSDGPSGKVLPPDFSRADIYDDHDLYS